MLEVLNLKLQQMHAALGDLESNDLSSLKLKITVTATEQKHELDFGQGTTPASVANAASTVLHNLGSLKDHLKKWCDSNNRTFDVESFVRSNIDVAVAHDLWNLDKHGSLRSRTQSGHHPKIVDLRQSLAMTTGKGPNSMFRVTIGPGGEVTYTADDPDSKPALIISGSVVNEHGVRLGDFAEICERACVAWEQAFVTAGVPTPPRA